MLGANCVDGVVIVADRKITDLITKSLVGYDEKIYGVLRNVIFAYEGAVDMFQGLHSGFLTKGKPAVSCPLMNYSFCHKALKLILAEHICSSVGLYCWNLWPLQIYMKS